MFSRVLALYISYPTFQNSIIRKYTLLTRNHRIHEILEISYCDKKLHYIFRYNNYFNFRISVDFVLGKTSLGKADPES